MEKIINSYYENGARKLHHMVNGILSKLGRIYNKDLDDFYSLANEVFTIVLRTYDGRQTFDVYLYSCLSNKIKTEMTRRNREKRRADLFSVSLDAPVGDGSCTIGDSLCTEFDMEWEENTGEQEERIEKYLDSLSSVQRRIVEMKMEEISVLEIKRRLHLTDSQYESHFAGLKAYENICILYNKDQITQKEEEEPMKHVSTQTMERCKTDKISVFSIIRKMDKHTIRFDHPLQRESDQWSPAMKGNLISDILQGNRLHPLIFAEQIINGVPIIWDLDGKQRCTNAYAFSKNGYKLTKNIRRWCIQYQAMLKDENGREVLDENGFPVAENREFDIRGKKFADLPEELQDRFMEYNFNYDQYLNCTESDIAYHIERYNDGKPMTASQRGITKLGTEYAQIVKSISNMPFFKDMGGYKVSEFKNGTIHRVVVESVMAVNYLEDWKKKQEDMCKYMKDHATYSDFDDFEDLVGRLEKAATEEVLDMFDSRDSFLWFGLFARFIKLGLADRKFIQFMTEFSQSLHGRKVDGECYDELNRKATKDKNVVIRKMEKLETLMKEYLGSYTTKPDLGRRKVV